MAYVQPLAPGFRYGLGTLSGSGEAGQLLKISGNNLLALNDDPAGPSFGILTAACRDGEMPGVYCQGGIYETDTFTGTVAPGAQLACDAATSTLKTAGENEIVVAEAISVIAGVLRFKLRI